MRSDLGRRVTARRKELALTRAQVAERSDSAPSYIEYVEERNAMPGMGFMLRLADALETTIGELTGSDLESPPGAARGVRSAALLTLSRKECLALMSTHGVGRLAVFSKTGPVILPVNYVVMEGRKVAYRTARGTVAAVADGEEVAFEVDHIDEVMRQGWSVNVVGIARAVTGDAASRGLDKGAYSEPWAGAERRLWFLITPTRITGRRIKTV